MLVEVRCDKFREKSIKFHKGLNVVLGDEKATNSIGKSSLLMVLDFIFEEAVSSSTIMILSKNWEIIIISSSLFLMM